MKVVVTGGNGVVGRYVVAELANPTAGGTAHAVTVFDRVKRRVPRGVFQIAGDHDSKDQLMAAFKGVDAVLHLSALPATTDSSEEVLQANVQGTANVFDAARRSGVKKVVNWSSVWALGWTKPGNVFIPDYLPIDEDHPLRADDPYGQSKIECEAIAESFHGQDGLEAMTLRSVYTALPAMMARLWCTNGIQNPIYSHLAYVDVFDHARGARRALETRTGSYVTVYLAADDSRRSLNRCRNCCRGCIPRLLIGQTSWPGHRSSISNQRAKDLLGWSPLNSWRRVSVPQKVRGYVTVNARSVARKALPAAATERLRSRSARATNRAIETLSARYPASQPEGAADGER